MQQKLPLTAEMIEKIKANIASHAQAFRSQKVTISSIGSEPAGRFWVESGFWPIDEAIYYFEANKFGERIGNEFLILNTEYFNTNLGSLPLPISFSLDKRIERELIIMCGMYAELYDLENRFRIFLSKINKSERILIPNKVQTNITKQKTIGTRFVVDTRTLDFEFADFGDIKKIIENNFDRFKSLVPC